MSTNPIVSIFEIPLVVDLICDSLDSQDYDACQRVNHSWLMAFQHQTWRSLFIVRPDLCHYEAPPLQITSRQQSKIARHAHLVHSLETALAPESVFLVKFKWSRLKNLKLYDHYNWANPDPLKWMKNIQKMTEAGVELLRHCPGLFSLTVTEYPVVGDYHLTDSLVIMLPTMRNLTLLKLAGIKCDRFLSTLEWIQKGCPDSLTELDLMFSQDGFKSLRIRPMEGNPLPSSKRLLSSLQKISVADRLRYAVSVECSPGLCHFLQHCPNLLDLRLPVIQESDTAGKIISTLIGYCPKMERFDLNCQPEWFEHTQRLLRSFSELKAFSYHHGSSAQNSHILDTLLEHSARTIEVLVIRMASYSFKNSDMCRILSSCPNLKTLDLPSLLFSDLEGILDERIPPEQFTIQDMINGPQTRVVPQDSLDSASATGSRKIGQGNQTWEWACQGLESLTLPVIFPTKNNSGLSVSHPSNTELVYEMCFQSIQLLKMLVSLPKLKVLELDWFWLWSGPGSRTPSSHVLGLLESVQGRKDVAKKLDIEWINSASLEWARIDYVYTAHAQMHGLDDFYREQDEEQFDQVFEHEFENWYEEQWPHEELFGDGVL